MLHELFRATSISAIEGQDLFYYVHEGIAKAGTLAIAQMLSPKVHITQNSALVWYVRSAAIWGMVVWAGEGVGLSTWKIFRLCYQWNKPIVARCILCSLNISVGRDSVLALP